MEYTLDRLKKILINNDFVECEFIILCSGKRDPNFTKESFTKDVIENKCYDEIDEDLIPILIELNEKGYKTSMSCSGHLHQIENNGRYESFINFKRPYEFSKPIPLFNKEKSKNKYSEIFGNSYKWYGNKNGSNEEKENDRKKLMKDLLEWAKGLEECNWVEKDYAKDGWIYLGGEKVFQYQE